MSCKREQETNIQHEAKLDGTIDMSNDASFDVSYDIAMTMKQQCIQTFCYWRGRNLLSETSRNGTLSSSVLAFSIPNQKFNCSLVRGAYALPYPYIGTSSGS
jgi:hypothetical protein